MNLIVTVKNDVKVNEKNHCVSNAVKLSLHCAYTVAKNPYRLYFDAREHMYMYTGENYFIFCFCTRI